MQRLYSFSLIEVLKSFLICLLAPGALGADTKTVSMALEAQ